MSTKYHSRGKMANPIFAGVNRETILSHYVIGYMCPVQLTKTLNRVLYVSQVRVWVLAPVSWSVSLNRTRDLQRLAALFLVLHPTFESLLFLILFFSFPVDVICFRALWLQSQWKEADRHRRLIPTTTNHPVPFSGNYWQTPWRRTVSTLRYIVYSIEYFKLFETS